MRKLFLFFGHYAIHIEMTFFSTGKLWLARALSYRGRVRNHSTGGHLFLSLSSCPGAQAPQARLSKQIPGDHRLYRATGQGIVATRNQPNELRDKLFFFQH